MPIGRWFLRTFSLALWGQLSARAQRAVSRVYASMYDRKWSRHLIEPYCRFNGMSEEYLRQFRPASGEEEYQSFQDFFTRRFKKELNPEEPMVWPCEGLLCDQGWVNEMNKVKVKGQYRNPRTIFGSLGEKIPGDHYFANIFLHNNDYHRIHAPIDGTVREVEKLEGELIVLRPWIYPEAPSLPAFRNERVNMRIDEPEGGASWFMSIVGGPAVAGISLRDKIEDKGFVKRGEELGTFLLGSTLCLAAPIKEIPIQLDSRVSPGQAMKAHAPDHA